MKHLKFTLLASLFTLSGLNAELPHIVSETPLRCDWTQINVNDVTFPDDFTWGAATSAFQIEGVATDGIWRGNTWTKAMDEGKAKQIGNACNHWELYKEDVQLIKNLGLNDYRYSICWSKVMPRESEFNAAAVAHYVDLTKELIANGITPYIMLFHHEWPLWFDELGAFEKAENIKHFVSFATYVFAALQNKLSANDFAKIRWMTFNEPTGYCLEGYFRGKYPPYKKNMALASTVLKNMFDAHVEIYGAFKRWSQNEAQVGLTEMIMTADPYNPYNPLDIATSSAAHRFLNNAAVEYFSTGKFSLLSPIKWHNPQAVGALDFFGVNFYYGLRFKGTKKKTIQNRIEWGDGKCMYPEGLYRAVKHVAQYLPNTPLLIGENGLSTHDPKVREDYIKTHLYVVSQLLKEGYDIRGYHWWALMDTYSWGKGEFSPYGFYAVNPETYERTLRSEEGFADFLSLIETGRYTSAQEPYFAEVTQQRLVKLDK